MTLRDRLARIVGLLRQEGRSFPAAVILLAQVSFRLRRHGYSSTRIWLAERSAGPARSGRPDDPPENQVRSARALAFVVRLAARLIPDATCLRKALVLQHLLTDRGVPAIVRFGARKTELDGLGFHAWVEVHDEVVSEEPDAVTPYSLLMDEPPPS